MQLANNIQPALIALALYSLLSIGFKLTVWAVCDKYDFWGWYDTYLQHKLGERCMLCIPFWFAVVYTLVIAFVLNNWFLMLSPFITAGITLKIAARK